MGVAHQGPSSLDVPQGAATPDTVRAGERTALRALERLLGGLASLFEPSWPRASAHTFQMASLGLIVAAGAVVRFWGLGAVGLHGDEDTMALATMGILHHGTPVLPSGMLYPRGTLELYLMAASVKVFGASEWAFRLPSALCGVLLVPLAYLSGRRFLSPSWSLALAATCALLPPFIEDAQTARMYVFLVTSVAAFVTLVFAWERTERNGYLAAAAVVLILGIEQHQLAIFASLILFYPGLLEGNLRKLGLGAAAFAAIAACFFLIGHWIEISYPAAAQLPDVTATVSGPLARAAVPQLALPGWIAGALVILALAAWVGRAVRGAVGAAAVGILVAAAGIAALLAYDHVAAAALIAALIIAARSGRPALRRASLVIPIGAAWMVFELWALHRAGVGLRQSVGALTGWPSIWPDLALARYSPLAAILLAAGIALACVWLARRQRIPDFLLFVVLGVWVPQLLIGLFMWSVATRYVAAESFPMLLGAFAAAQWLTLGGQSPAHERARRQSAFGWLRVALPAAVFLLAANPVSLARSAYGGYTDHPDHQGAARFVLAQHPRPRDIVLAEDVLEQTYYLGHVDYWLEGRGMASDFVHRVNGKLEDFYTDTPLIGTGAELESLISRRDRGAIYIIGSGEQQEDGRSEARGPEIQRILHSLSGDVVYVGRDHLTKVWKIPAPGTAGG